MLYCTVLQWATLFTYVAPQSQLTSSGLLRYRTLHYSDKKERPAALTDDGVNGVIRCRLTGLIGAGPRRLYVGLRRSRIGQHCKKGYRFSRPQPGYHLPNS
jgi:hypothetical protein